MKNESMATWWSRVCRACAAGVVVAALAPASAGASATPSGADDVSAWLNVSPRKLSAGQSATLTWSSSGATDCRFQGARSGAVEGRGSYWTGPLERSRYYQLICSNGVHQAMASVTVQVDAVPVVRWRAPTRNADGSALDDLAGYRLYWGTKPRQYAGSAWIDSPYWTQYTPFHLPSGTYYVAVTAVDDQGNESSYSNEIRVTVP